MASTATRAIAHVDMDAFYASVEQRDRPELRGTPVVVGADPKGRGVEPAIVYAVLAHADYSGMPRVSLLDRALYACDELSGFVHACALVRPGRVISGLEAASVRKKLKDKGFARTVNRDDVYRGAAELGVDLDAHIAFVVQALESVAPDIGLGRA